jgi:SAM-dependent methyltransferase
MTSYILESEKEFERLERQSRNPSYDYRRELGELSVKAGDLILDAGCGSGLVSRYLAEKYPAANVTGCDRVKERLEGAKEVASKFSNLKFIAGDLTQLPLESNSFDFVVCRYVMQHLRHDSKNREVIREIFRVLKPGGEAKIIDGDGFITNLYPQPTEVAETVDQLLKTGPIDFQIGRKIPSYMIDAGFEAPSWRVDTFDFQGDGMDVEISLMRERFEQAKPFLDQFLVGEGAAENFTEQAPSIFKTCSSYPHESLS